MSKNQKLWIDGCAGSELKDTQGETLSVEGADISELQAGRGRWNDNHGVGFANSLGMITEAKKIFKADDCENERHTYYWDKIKAPYIYAKGYLHNNEDHPNARAAAAILRNIHREDCPLKVKMSVEGGIIARGITDPTRLARTKMSSVALTFTPANTATLAEPLNLDKSSQDWEADQQLIKSVMHLAETNIPSFRHIERHASANTIIENISKIKDLAKTLGVDIQISESTPETIIKQAATYKIEQNILKINELVKMAINPKTGLAIKPISNATRENQAAKEQGIKQTRSDKFQQEIGQAKVQSGMGPHVSSIPNTPIPTGKPEIMPIKSGNQFTQDIADKRAALKPVPLKFADHVNNTMSDPTYLDNLHAKFQAKGIDPVKAQQVINQIRTTANANKVIKYSNIKDNLIKALTAGFGGAGSPGDLTGGGVFQSESLESPRRSAGMKYISCDNCGKEDVHMKHQVRCRNCGKNYNFDKLKDLI